MLALNQLTKKIRNQSVLDGISCHIDDGTIAGVLGPNQSGKSVLLKVLAGFMHKTSGTVMLDGKVLSGVLQKTCAFIPPENALPLHLTLSEMLRWFPIMYPDLDKELASEYCQHYFQDFHRTLSAYSHGDLAKLNLILGCCRNVRLYLLDEPLQDIDETSRSILVSLISTCPDKSAIFLISSHDPNEYEKILDQVLFLKLGKLVTDEKPELLRSRLHQSITEYYRKVMNHDEYPSV